MQLRKSLIKNKDIAAVPILIGMLAILPMLTAGAEVIEGIAAIVNDEIIACSELEEFLSPHILYINKNFPEDVRQEKIALMRKEVLEGLIEEKLLLSEAGKEGVVVSDEELKMHLGLIKKKFGSEENFKLQLSEEKLTEEKFKERMREQITVKNLVDLKIASQIETSSGEEVEEFFKRNKKEFKARQKEFSEVRGEIKDRLYRLKMEEALGKWLKELKEKAYIQIIDK
jgi:parvulin-like peptidyl-prolyl isomerase